MRACSSDLVLSLARTQISFLEANDGRCVHEVRYRVLAHTFLSQRAMPERDGLHSHEAWQFPLGLYGVLYMEINIV